MSQLFEVNRIDDVVVVSFKKMVVFDLEEIGVMGEGVASSIVLGVENNFKKFVIDFGIVEFLQCGFLRHLVSLRRRVDIARGRIVLCGLNPQPYGKFLETKIYQLFTIVKDEEEALAFLRNI